MNEHRCMSPDIDQSPCHIGKGKLAKQLILLNAPPIALCLIAIVRTYPMFAQNAGQETTAMQMLLLIFTPSLAYSTVVILRLRRALHTELSHEGISIPQFRASTLNIPWSDIQKVEFVARRRSILIPEPPSVKIDIFTSDLVRKTIYPEMFHPVWSTILYICEHLENDIPGVDDLEAWAQKARGWR